VFLVTCARLSYQQGWNCRGVEVRVEPPSSLCLHTRIFWVKIGFKFQSLGKIANISTFRHLTSSSFRSVPTLAIHTHGFWVHVTYYTLSYRWFPMRLIIKTSFDAYTGNNMALMITDPSKFTAQGDGLCLVRINQTASFTVCAPCAQIDNIGVSIIGLSCDLYTWFNCIL